MNRLKEGRYGQYLYNDKDAYVGRSIHEYGEYGQHEAELFSAIGGNGYYAVEVGANIGSLTMALAKDFSKVYAFEPQMGLFKMLCANMALNNFDHVDCYNMGASDEDTEITLPSIDYNHDGNYGAFEIEQFSGQGTLKTRIVKLDDFLDLPSLRLLKVDVEGMEEQVLKGAEKAITQYKPFLYVENDRPDKSQSLIEYIWSLGYRCYWHIVPLFHEDNFAKNETNVFGVGHSFNMVCSPDVDMPLTKITDSSDHPLSRSQ